MNELKWYVLKAISGQESKVKTYIETEIKRVGYESYVTQVIIPIEKVIQMRNGKKILKERTTSKWLKFKSTYYYNLHLLVCKNSPKLALFINEFYFTIVKAVC